MEAKWFWMMNYCKKKRIPPAQSWAWREAEEAYKYRDDMAGLPSCLFDNKQQCPTPYLCNQCDDKSKGDIEYVKT